MSEIVEKLDSPNDVISGICLTDEEVAGIMEVREEHILYLGYAVHSWRTHYVDCHVCRGLSWMIATPDHWHDWIA